jgi:hypothetical protein
VDCRHVSEERKLHSCAHGDDSAALRYLQPLTARYFSLCTRGLLSAYFPNQSGFACKDILEILLQYETKEKSTSNSVQI